MVRKQAILATLSGLGEEQQEEARGIVESLFYCIDFGGDKEGRERLECPKIDSWAHRPPEKFESDWRSFRIDRQGFRNAADEYVNRPWMARRDLDWFVLDALTYAECIAYLDHVRISSMGFWRYLSSSVSNGKHKFLAIAGAVLWTGLKWFVWLIIAAFAFLTSIVFGAVVLLLTAWHCWRQYRRSKLLVAPLVAMTATYSSMQEPSLSWRIIWDELAVSRGKGVVWDGVVYRLVEQRMGV